MARRWVDEQLGITKPTQQGNLGGQSNKQPTKNGKLYDTGDNIVSKVVDFAVPRAKETALTGLDLLGATKDYAEYKGANVNPFALKDKGAEKTKQVREYATKMGRVKQSLAKSGFEDNNFDPVKYGKESFKGGAELAAWMAPVGKGSLSSKMFGTGVSGGMFEASRDDATPTSIVSSAITSAAAPAVTSLFGKAFKGLVGDPKRWVMGMFKPTNTEIQELKKYAQLDFADEVLNKETNNLVGKKPEQVAQYLTSKADEMTNAADEFLSQQTGKTLQKQKVLNILQSEIQKRSSNRAGQKAALTELQNYIADISSNFSDDIDLVTANQLKRDLQQGAKRYYTTSGSPSAESEALATVSREVNNMIEAQAPGVKDINRQIMFYKTAQDAYDRQLNAYMKSPQGIQRLAGPAFLSSIGASASMISGGNPVVGAMVGAPWFLTEILRKPSTQARLAKISKNSVGKQAPDVIQKLGTFLTSRGAGAVTR